MLVRGFMVDSARCLERRAYYRNLIDFMAERGMNTLLWHFTDDQGCTLHFDSVPGIGGPNAYSKPELRRLVKYARSRGIDLIPEVASLGHSLYITRLSPYAHLNESKTIFTGICPVSDETRQVIRALIEEAATVFDSPNFHVGLDEANFGEHPLTAEALKTRTKGQLFADHIEFVHGVVTSLGRRMWMWGDGILHDAEVARRVPRDVVVCNWQYRPIVPVESTQFLLDQGFDVVLCPALISHDQTLFPGEEFAVPNVRCMKAHEAVRGNGRGKMLGTVCTIWTGVRFMADAMWPAIHLAAAVQRESAEVETEATLAEFAGEYFGLGGDDAQVWAGVCARVMRLSPLRKEWLAIGKGTLPEGQTAEQVEARGADWAELGATLRGLSGKVTENRRAFRTFRLMVEVVAHWYAMAGRLAMTGAPTESELESKVLRGMGLLARVERTWDLERFGDDPKKVAPPVEFFRDDHLILLLKQGLESAKGRMPKGWTGERATVKVRAKTSAVNQTFIR